jgi:cell division protein FtsL
VLGGVVWIGVIALLAAGVVAMNVLLLQLNVGYDDLGRERAQLKADIAHLESQLSSAAANARIARQAQEHLGLVEADPETTTYVTIAP